MKTYFARRLTDRAYAACDSPAGARSFGVSLCAPAHNTPLPLKRSPLGSFKRLLGGAASPFYTHQPSRGNIVAELAPRCEHEDHTEHDRLVGAIGQKLYQDEG